MAFFQLFQLCEAGDLLGLQRVLAQSSTAEDWQRDTKIALQCACVHGQLALVEYIVV